MRKIEAIRTLNQYLTEKKLRSLMSNKLKSFGTLRLAKLLVELSSEYEVKELIYKIYNPK